jgi:hypothetical protein
MACSSVIENKEAKGWIDIGNRAVQFIVAAIKTYLTVRLFSRSSGVTRKYGEWFELFLTAR